MVESVIAKPVRVREETYRTTLVDADGEVLLQMHPYKTESLMRVAAELNSTCQALADELSLKSAKLDVAWQQLDARGRSAVMAVCGTVTESGVTYPVMRPDSIRVERSTTHYHVRHDIEHEHDGGHEPHHHEESAL